MKINIKIFLSKYLVINVYFYFATVIKYYAPFHLIS